MTTHRPRRRLLLGATTAAGNALLPFGNQVHAKAINAVSPRFVIGQNDFLLDGKPLQIRCGGIHFARMPPEYWSHRLQAIKAMGLNTVCAYLF